jgi:FMN phosphatase YigB (HAD superfamily)
MNRFGEAPRRQGKSRMPRIFRRAPLLLLLLVLPAPPAAAACLKAIFFDLGDTLVEAGGGGMFVLRAGAQETVDQLQAAGLELGIITNVPAGWTREDLEAVMAQPEFLDEFDVLVLSSQAPAPKPNPAIYIHAHGLLPTPVPIGQTAFVGETLSEIANTQNNPTSGARAAGMVGIHLSGAAPSPLADFTIASLAALPPLAESSCALFRDGFESGGTAQWQ